MGFIGAYLGLAVRRLLAASTGVKLGAVVVAVVLTCAGVVGFGGWGTPTDQFIFRTGTPKIILPARSDSKPASPPNISTPATGRPPLPVTTLGSRPPARSFLAVAGLPSTRPQVMPPKSANSAGSIRSTQSIQSTHPANSGTFSASSGGTFPASAGQAGTPSSAPAASPSPAPAYSGSNPASGSEGGTKTSSKTDGDRQSGDHSNGHHSNGHHNQDGGPAGKGDHKD